MATFSKVILSGSIDGKLIKIAQQATAGTVIHTAHATAIDEVHLWAYNDSATDRELTIECGGVSVADDLMLFTVPSKDGGYPIFQGFPFTNSKVIAGFCVDEANAIFIIGFVNRITA